MKKRLWFSAGLYVFCCLIWAANFFIHWHQDGMIEFSTALFGVASVMFAIAAAGSILALIRYYRNTEENKEAG
ncbi:MAG: hypothetical protein IKL25_01550 [Clostridia bacterium]|nr:hypothetical protein [Clostridia bacterium]